MAICVERAKQLMIGSMHKDAGNLVYSAVDQDVGRIIGFVSGEPLVYFFHPGPSGSCIRHLDALTEFNSLRKETRERFVDPSTGFVRSEKFPKARDAEDQVDSTVHFDTAFRIEVAKLVDPDERRPERLSRMYIMGLVQRAVSDAKQVQTMRAKLERLKATLEEKDVK